MINFVQLEPEGLFVYKWDGKKKQQVRRRAKKSIVLTYLRCRCQIKEGTTLKDIFRAVAKYKLLCIVIGQYSWCSHINEFHAQAEEPMRSEDKGDKLEYLEIYWHPEVHEYTETIKHPGGHKEKIRTVSFDAHTGFHAIGEPGSSEHRPDGREHYSVSYSPMYDLADLPVKLNEEFEVWSPWKRGQKQELLIKATRSYSLLEVLDAIYDDISFMGGPAENAAFLENMKETVEEIKSGTVETIPFEDIKKELGLDDEEDKEPGLMLNIHLDDQPTRKMELVSCARLELNEYLLVKDGEEEIRVQIKQIEENGHRESPESPAETVYWCSKEQKYEVRLGPQAAEFFGVPPAEPESS